MAKRGVVDHRTDMRAIVAMVVAVTLYCALEGASAACDRARSPLEEPAVAAAIADVVAVVDVTSVGGGLATVLVNESLKGRPKNGDKLVIAGLLSGDEARARGSCGVTAVEAGKRYIALLWEPISGSTRLDMVEPATSVIAHTTAARSSIDQALAKQHPGSGWQGPAAGLQTRVALDPYSQPGEVDLFVLVRNTGAVAVDLVHQSWPRAQQSTCALRIQDAANRTVDARDVPIPRPDIDAYFSRNSRVYTTKIEPGASWLIHLPRVTTAAPGWGYKEELGFQYYPVTTHGLHKVAADCVNFFGPGSHVSTSTVTLSL
jgi:hypothetical protein